LNLFDMLRRKDANLVVQGAVKISKGNDDRGTWRGLQLPDGSSFRIPDIRRFVTFRTFPEQCGWTVDAPEGTTLRVSIVHSGTNEVLGTRTYEGARQPLLIPWPQAIPGQVDLLAEHVGSARMPVVVTVHRALSRQWLFDTAMGRGVEIGPGAQPQILPKEGRHISYLEQMPPEEWNRLYNAGGKYTVRPELWDNYIVGDAFDLPVPDGSLDFIFGSHVFEQLATPIGHLKRWQARLTPGGKIICVVPDLAGTKDAIQERSTLAEWLEEFATDVWEPTERHYCRHLRSDRDSRIVVAAMERRESIHVHYYDNINARDLLDFAVRELGYADFMIEHTPNHKDFHFILQNR
jgi:hypothetical protein